MLLSMSPDALPGGSPHTLASSLYLPTLIALTLAACGANTGEPTNDAGAGPRAEAMAGEETEDVRLPLLAGPQDGDLGMEAELRAEGRCLYAVQPGRPDKSLLAFSGEDVRWDAAGGRLILGDAAFAPGDRVDLGGSVARDRVRLQWLREPDPSCDAGRMFVVTSIGPARERPGG